MPKIGHIVLHRDTLKDRNSSKILLADPFSVLYAPEFPYTTSFTVNVGLFNLKHSIEYDFSYSVTSPTGENIEAKFLDLSTEPKKEGIEEDHPIHITFNLALNDITFEQEGVHCFMFQINNLHESKMCFFYVQKGDNNE